MFQKIGWHAAVLVASIAPSAAWAAERSVQYKPAGAWVSAPPVLSLAPPPPGAPFRVIYADQQVRISKDKQEEYQASRISILTAEALALGNVGIAWSPSNEDVLVHRLAINRAGRKIDVLAAQKFTVIQRENNLELSMLDGNLTATLQVDGLQVGDELEFAATKVHRQSKIADLPQGFFQFPLIGAHGAYRLRVIQPSGSTVTYRASADVPPPIVRAIGPETEREYLMADPASATIPEGAPARYLMTRLVHYSAYADWSAVARTFTEPFRLASSLQPNSPIREEARMIAARTSDPVRRAEAALRLVQDRVRYVYVGLDGGNYLPVSADETWRRRFGDCKGKTALLIALLRELGISAEPVLVSSKGGDGIDERLPTPAVFDHVVVRASLNGAAVWLDGTRSGDTTIANLERPLSRWALPLRAGAKLEAIGPAPARYPARIEAMEIDASNGFANGKYHVQQTLRGDEIFAMRAQLAAVAAPDADKLLRAYFRQAYPYVDPTGTSWRFDDANRLLVLSMDGDGKVDTDGNAVEGYTHYLFAGGFSPPAEMRRPRDQPQNVPWANDYPAFNCYAARVKLPPAGKGLRWAFSSKPMDRLLGGISYWRISAFNGSIASVVKSRRVNVPEISAKEALTVNAAAEGFDNQKAYAWEVPAGERSDTRPTNTSGSLWTFEDFSGPKPPCQSLTASAN